MSDGGGGAKLVPFTRNREYIYDWLNRAKKYHCSVSGGFELDVTDLQAAIAKARAEGKPASLVAALVRATALVLVKYPRLNHHMFHGLLRKYEVEFDEVSCNLILMRRGEGGERMLFPVVLRNADRLSVADVQAAIDHHKEAPLAELPQVAAIRRLESLPRLALRWFSYKARSDWRFYLKHFGTYGLSSLMSQGFGGTSATTLANTAAAFIPGLLSPRAIVRDGKIEAREILHLLLVVDHYVVDGNDALLAMKYLRRLIERPALLGLT